MNNDPNPSKQAQKVIFGRGKKKNHPPLVFISSYVSQATSQKYPDIVLGTSLIFKEHLTGVVNKTNKGIGLLRKPQNVLLRSAFIAIYKAFFRLYLFYGDILCD